MEFSERKLFQLDFLFFIIYLIEMIINKELENHFVLFWYQRSSSKK